MEQTWTDVDEHFAHTVAPPNDLLTAALAATAAAGVPPISVTARGSKGYDGFLLAQVV